MTILRSLVTLTLLLGLGGCGGAGLRPLLPLNRQLAESGANREPSLGDRWLALISSRNGREQVLLVDLRSGRPVPVPGLNRPDAQPVSVSVDANGERLAMVRQRQDRTELTLYRRSSQSLQPLPLDPPGVPRQVSLSADGRVLAVQISRNGLWQVDLIELP